MIQTCSCMCNSLLSLVSLTRMCPQLNPTAHQDDTAGIRTQRSGFNRHEQNVYFLPILVVDSGPPSLSSTGTLTIHVCGCDTGESYSGSYNINVTVTSCISSDSTKKVNMSSFCLANSSYKHKFYRRQNNTRPQICDGCLEIFQVVKYSW